MAIQEALPAHSPSPAQFENSLGSGSDVATPPAAHEPAPAADKPTVVYEIKEHDLVGGIALRFNVSPDELRTANKNLIGEQYQIRPGDKIVLPPNANLEKGRKALAFAGGSTHEMTTGERLTRFAGPPTFPHGSKAAPKVAAAPQTPAVPQFAAAPDAANESTGEDTGPGKSSQSIEIGYCSSPEQVRQLVLVGRPITASEEQSAQSNPAGIILTSGSPAQPNLSQQFRPFAGKSLDELRIESLSVGSNAIARAGSARSAVEAPKTKPQVVAKAEPKTEPKVESKPGPKLATKAESVKATPVVGLHKASVGAPPAVKYTLGRNDVPQQIAARFDTSVAAIEEMNPGVDLYRAKPGTDINLPRGSKIGAPAGPYASGIPRSQGKTGEGGSLIGIVLSRMVTDYSRQASQIGQQVASWFTPSSPATPAKEPTQVVIAGRDPIAGMATLPL